MNRVAWLVLASCAAAPQHRDPPIRSAATPSPPAPSITTEARLALTGGAWLDVVVDGVDATAQRQCTWLVEHPGPGIPPDARVDRACAANTLPPLPLRTALLVTEELVDANTVIVENLLEAGPHRESDTYLTSLHGKRLTYQPMDSLAACERIRRQLASDQARQDADYEATIKADVDRKLADVITQETDVCTRAADTEASCERKTGDARSKCLLDAGLPRISCDELKRRHAQLDIERNVRPTPRGETQRCEAAPA